MSKSPGDPYALSADVTAAMEILDGRLRVELADLVARKGACAKTTDFTKGINREYAHGLKEHSLCDTVSAVATKAPDK